MASYQPPVDTTAIFNSQSFSASNYTGESDPNKLDFPNAQGTPTMPSVNISDGINASLITPTGITTSGAQGESTIDIIQIPEKNTANTFTQNQSVTDGTNTSTLSATQLSTTASPATTLTINQTPQLNTQNTFTTTQVYNGSTLHNLGILLGQNYGINLSQRNNLGVAGSVATSAFIGTASISTTTLTTTSPNPLIVIGTTILGSGVTAGTLVTAVISSTSFTVNNSQTSTPTAYLPAGAGTIIQIQSINNGSGGSGTTMTIASITFTLPIGTFISGVGVAVGSRITAIVTAPTVYTLSASSLISSTINGLYILQNSFNTSYPISPTHSVIPSSLSSYTISLPHILSVNAGTTTTFRVTAPAANNVSITSLNSIYLTNTTTGVNTHNIYTGGTSILFSATSTTASITTTTLTLTGATPPTLTVGTLITGGATLANTYITAVGAGNTYTVNNSQTATPTNYNLTALTTHTFMALPTTLGTGGFGWFQLGTV